MVFKKILTHGCVFYTVLMTLFTLGSFLLYGSELKAITVRLVLSLLCISMGLSAVNVLTGKLKLPFGGKLCIHFVSTALLYYLIFVLCGGLLENGTGTLAAMLIFLAAYALGTAAVLIKKRLAKNSGEKPEGQTAKNDENGEYHSIFKK